MSDKSKSEDISVCCKYHYLTNGCEIDSILVMVASVNRYVRK